MHREMIKRPRQIDYFRTVTRINVWEEFNSFDNDGMGSNNGPSSSQFNNAQVATLNGDKNDKETIALLKKMEIPIITSQQTQKLQGNSAANNQSVTDEIYKKRRMQTSNYIRIRQDQIWPLQEKYELADDDVAYLKEFNDSNKFSMREEELETIIESFEMRSTKDYILSWLDMKDHISNEIRDKYTFTNLEKIYNYWKTKRDLLKRPLLRLHWKPNFNDKDPHVAFRPRVAEKMKLRKSMKQNDQEQLQKLLALKDEMAKYKLMVQQIKLREQMKEWILESQSLAFVSELYKIDKQMQYFFVDDVLESHKEVEQKKQKLDEKYASLHSQNNQLSEQLQTYNLLPAGYVKPSKNPIRATPSSTNKEQKPNQEFQKTTEATQQPTTTSTAASQPLTNSNLLNDMLKDKEKKKNKPNRPPSEEIPAPNPEVESNLIKKKKDKPKKGEQGSVSTDSTGHLINITIPKENSVITPAQQSSSTTKQSSLSQTSSANQQKADTVLTISTIPPIKTSEKEVPAPKGKSLTKKQEKLGDDSAIKQSTKQVPADPPSQNIDQLRLSAEKDAETSKSVNEGKESQNPAIPNLSLFNTDNFEFASFIASIFIEASKRELTVEKVCNIDTKSIDREQFSNILNSKSELAEQLKKLRRNINPGMVVMQNSNRNPPHSLEYQSQIQGIQMNQPPYMQQGQMPGPGLPSEQGRRMSQPFQPQGQMYPDTSLVSMQPGQEIAHTKKKNVIHFKPRLRIGRSGLVNIDRQFDDRDNLRYEDICSKEANYHPNKVVDKLLAQQRLKERAEQQKLKVYSFTPTDTELYKKDYFQQRQLKFKALADDDETQLLYPSAPSSTNIGAPVSSQALSSSQGYSQAQLNGAQSSVAPQSNLEGSQMIIEDSQNMLSSSMTQQQIFNNDQDIKLLRKSISVALKNYQKSKQQNQLK